MEILSLVGNVSLIDGVPFIHAHICVSDNTFSIIGGHVKSCIISLTCEIYLQSYYPKIHRIKNEKLGISTLNLKVS
jgi:predicted DNA-binding protein with PD1-like motif